MLLRAPKKVQLNLFADKKGKRNLFRNFNITNAQSISQGIGLKVLLGHLNRFPQEFQLNSPPKKKEMSSSSKMNGHCARALPAPVHNHPPPPPAEREREKKWHPPVHYPEERERDFLLSSLLRVCVGNCTLQGFFLAFRAKGYGKEERALRGGRKSIFFLACAVYYLTTGGGWTRGRGKEAGILLNFLKKPI